MLSYYVQILNKRVAMKCDQLGTDFLVNPITTFIPGPNTNR